MASEIKELLGNCDRLVTLYDPDLFQKCVHSIESLVIRLESVESHLVANLEAQHGKGKAGSPGFRQFMAEYMVSFPAANLDYTRAAVSALKKMLEWFRSPACTLAFESVFVLSGAAGSGKTHGVCDAADHRLRNGLFSGVAFGHEFRGEPNPWTRLLETFGLPASLGTQGLLDALNAAGEASGAPLILFIDAVNETRPLRYWRDRMSSFSEAIQGQSNLRICFTCRTSFLAYCLPDQNNLQIVEHSGFAGLERDACKAFFHYYDLNPPIAPILQPEFSNPLYLRLVCETLRSRGLRQMPTGWQGLAPTIRAFLSEKERQFAMEHETSEGANIVSGCLMAIVRKIVESGESALAWSKALREISGSRPQAISLPVLEWLVRADLLVEDVPAPGASLGDESVVRPAFERLGDFLVAAELLERGNQKSLMTAFQPGGMFHHFILDSDSLKEFSGVLAALSILVPEMYPGTELPNLVTHDSTRCSILRIAVRSFPSRDPATFTSASASLILEALAIKDFSFEAMDVVVSTSWQPSEIDAFWLDRLLKRKPLAKRDAYWCGYLHDRFESQGAVLRIIEAVSELPLGQVKQEIALRWATALLWFTAAADRRVKDKATRSATALLSAHPIVIPEILEHFLFTDDDEVRERVLLCCYGALILTRDGDLCRVVAKSLTEEFFNNPKGFDNALIRDHIRCIIELAKFLNVLPNEIDPESFMDPIGSDWPLSFPSDKEIQIWKGLPKLAHSCLSDDFFIYAMACMRPWEHEIPKQDMGKWILERVARNMGYEGSECERYDGCMLGQHGGGRSKPNWAERIGKKYQWVAMYQLASRLHDHVDRKRDDWDPKLLRRPLILLEERKADPTLPSKIAGGERDIDNWWVGSPVDFCSAEGISDHEWVAKKTDVPAFEIFLKVKEWDGQKWRILVTYPSLSNRGDDSDFDSPYRDLWIHIESFLVPEKFFTPAFECLKGRNFFGKWLPEGAHWLYGFLGEYPWGTSFNTENEEWHGRGTHGNQQVVNFEPSWNQVNAEWQYDASLPRNPILTVPARIFFSHGDLWWNGQDGYRLVSGRTFFKDPSVTSSGPSALMVDDDDLRERLDKLGLRLIWTLLGEKMILGEDHSKETPRITFSQIAALKQNGGLVVGERVFFRDYDKDVGPREPGKQKTACGMKSRLRRGI